MNDKPILLVESKSEPGTFKIKPAITAKLKLEIIKTNPVKKCKLNSKKIYKIYEDEKQVKAQVDVLKVAIREIKANKSVGFNKNAGVEKIEKASGVMEFSAAKIEQLKKDWDWLADNRKTKNTTTYKSNEKIFFKNFRSKRLDLKLTKYPKAKIMDWIKHSAPAILDVICEVADSEVSALLIWLNAYQEGMADYVTDSTNAHNRAPTKLELSLVRVDEEVDGYVYLGLDDFWLDYKSKKYPLKDFLPKNYSISDVKVKKVLNDDPYNPRYVKSAKFKNMKLGLQSLKANIKRRSKIMTDDMEKYGYESPTNEDRIYWYFNYSNAGAGVSKRSLKKYQNKRKLGDWIKLKKYSNSLQFLDSYKLANELGLFK